MLNKEKESPILFAERHTKDCRLLTANRYFFTFLYKRFTRGTFYRFWKSILAYLRRLRMIALLLRILSLALAVIQTGALVILTTAIFLVLLPLFAALMLGILLTALIESRKTNRFFKTFLANKTIYVLFASEASGPFFFESARLFASRVDTAVLIVSPYWISSKGFGGKGFYSTARKETENVFLIRRYYFFSLRHHAIEKDRSVYVY